MLRLGLVLLGVILVYMSHANSESKAKSCYYNLMVLKAGYKFYEGCEKCKCTKKGEFVTDVAI